MKYEILDSRDRIGNKTEDNGLVFNDVENNKAFFEHSAAFNTGCVAGTMGYEVASVGDFQHENTTYLTFDVPLFDNITGEELATELNKYKGELISVIAGNNYDCVSTIYDAYYLEGDSFVILYTKYLDEGYVNWDKSKFPPKNKVYIYFPKHPEVGNIVVNEAPAFATGVGSVASQEASAVFGENCYAAGKRSFAAGRDNVSGYISATFGRKNMVRGQYGLAGGYQNDIATSVLQGTVFGLNNKVKSNNTLIEGSGNTDGYGQPVGANHIEGTGNTIKDGCYGLIHIEGEGNIVEAGGQDTHIEGKGNTVKTGALNHVTGMNNTVNGGYNTVHGTLISVNGTYNDIGGNNNAITNNGTRNFVRGNGNITSGSNQAIFGKNCADNTDAIFIVGNGDNVNQRKNAFEILSDGSATIAKAGRSPDGIVRYDQFVQKLYKELEPQFVSTDHGNGELMLDNNFKDFTNSRNYNGIWEIKTSDKTSYCNFMVNILKNGIGVATIYRATDSGFNDIVTYTNNNGSGWNAQ